MTEIIDLKTERAKRMIPLGSYFVRVDHYDDGLCGEVMLEDMDAQQLRNVSHDLFVLARYIHDQAWKMTDDADDRTMSVTWIYESGRVLCWTADAIDNEERAEWLRRRLSDAADASAPSHNKGTAA